MSNGKGLFDRSASELSQAEPARLLVPDPQLLVMDIEAGGPATFGPFHRHRWGKWGATFSSAATGGAFSGLVGTPVDIGPWWQERVCVRCGRAQRARVEVETDR